MHDSENFRYHSENSKIRYDQGFQTRTAVLTRGGERVKGSEVQPDRTGIQPDRTGVQPEG